MRAKLSTLLNMRLGVDNDLPSLRSRIDQRTNSHDGVATQDDQSQIGRKREERWTAKEGKNMILFYGGHMSQWCYSPMVIDGQTFTCAEQWMMYSKARYFGDIRAGNAIMATNDPEKQKAIGRRVCDFDADIWNKVSFDIVFKGNLAKYQQNQKFKALLLSTNPHELVEASPTDCIWGIGLAEDDPRAQYPALWHGENRLGKVLMQVRREIA